MFGFVVSVKVKVFNEKLSSNIEKSMGMRSVTIVWGEIIIDCVFEQLNGERTQFNNVYIVVPKHCFTYVVVGSVN